MDTLLNAYRDDDDTSDAPSDTQPEPQFPTSQTTPQKSPNPEHEIPNLPSPSPKPEPITFSPSETTPQPTQSPKPEPEPMSTELTKTEDDMSTDSISEEPSPKKHKPLSLLEPEPETPTPNALPKKPPQPSKKKKSKNSINNVWTKPTSRKGKKKKTSNNANNGNPNGANSVSATPEESMTITPILKFPDRNDDTPEAKICLSKVYKAEKVEISEDRMAAGSGKGYRMVRATRGVSEGAWYFEIKVLSLGETGHCRLGWATEKGDLQAPVGYDGWSFGYRDVDGSKVHKALREKYGGEGFGEGDVIGFYVSLPDGEKFAPKPPKFVYYKGQRYVCAPEGGEDDQPLVVPGSEISFFKNGICQGVAFKDLYGGRYYPAASMYTLPNQPNCTVRFNFGPVFECFPADFEGRPLPRPMIEVPYHGFDKTVENGISDEKKE